MSTTEKHPFDIVIRCERIGKDYLFLITGGEVHIGAVATAFYQDEEIYTELAAVPGHREDRLALECAGIACERLRAVVTVIMGIHIEKASRGDIELAVQTVREQMICVLDQLLS